MAKKAQPRREPLTPKRIYQTALVLMQETGVEDLSMRKLAGALGVDAMSIYHHVENKQALLLGVFQAVLEEVPLPEPAPADWKQALRELGKGFYLVAQRYPNLFPYMISSPYGTPREREIYQYIRSALQRGGIREEDRLRATSALYTYGIGMANVASAGLSLKPLYGEPLPEQGAPEQEPSDDDVEFSIDLILAGLESHIRGNKR